MNILLVGSLGKMANKVKEIADENDTKIIAEIDKNFVCEIKENFTSKSERNFVHRRDKNQSKKSSKFFDQNKSNCDVKYYKNCYTNFKKIPKKLIAKIDVVLDFSNPTILKEELDFCVHNNLPVAICSTGHNQDNIDTINRSSKIIPICLSANTSFGINLISKILKTNINNFQNFDVNIIDTHHKDKKDIPSGTAKEFAKILSTLSPTTLAIRTGEIVGNHDIILTSNFEQIAISHKAFDRKIFAKGALNICHFLNKKMPPKLYTMQDIFD